MSAAPSPDGRGRGDAGPVAADERLRAAVLCLCDAARPGSVVGTGFVVAPGLVLTCAHVAVQLRGRAIRVDDRAGLVAEAGEPAFPPDPGAVDLALLPVAVPETLALACWAGALTGERVAARGYAPAPGAWGPGGRVLRFTRRGVVRAEYGGHAIDEAFELAEDMAEGGFSGSPLLDVASGAVVGVVSGGDASRGRSWAVPLRGAAAGWPALERALAWNEAHVPRWGRAVNAAGARVACGFAAGVAVRQFQDRGKFDPALHVDRSAVPPLVEAFRGAARPAMAIVSGSNTGKTWLLCDLARTPEFEPCLLLAAGDLPRDSAPGLEAFASAALRAGWPEGADVPEPPSAGGAAAAIAADGTRLLVMLDGVNEALDVRGFGREWLPEGVAWAGRCGARLLLTSRPEPWPALARRLAPDALHDPAAVTDAPIEARCARLGDFTAVEAAAAVGRYGLAAGLARALGRHPLMFRLALHRPGSAAGPGLYRMIDAFVQWHLDEASGVLGLRSSASLRERLRGVAGAMLRQESLALPLAQVREALGGDAALDALVGCGLLAEAGARGEAIRFTFDQVGEATAPAPDPATLFVSPENQAAWHGHFAGLLRLEADGDEAGFEVGLGRLLDMIGTIAAEAPPPRRPDGRPAGFLGALQMVFEGIGEAVFKATVSGFGEIACTIARALPPGRQSAIDRLYRCLVPLAPHLVRSYGYGDLVRWLDEAPVGEALRARLALQAAPWADGHPYRQKDWRDAACAYALSGEGRDEIGSVLAGGLRRDPAGVVPVLVAALADETRIDQGLSDDARGEASVASLAGAVLFNGRGADLPGVVAAVLAQEGDMAAHLMRAIGDAEGPALIDLVLPALADRARCVRATWALRDTAGVATPAQRAAATSALEARLGPGPEGLEAAVALRALDPGRVAAWDRVAAAVDAGVAAGSHLAPVPPERFERALVLARERAPEGALWMAEHQGPEGEQARMAAAIVGLDDAAFRRFDIGWVIERRLRALAREDGAALRPWVEAAAALARRGDAVARRGLVYAVFKRGGFARDPGLAGVAALLLDTVDSDEEAGLIAECVVDAAQARGVAWRPVFDRLRQAHAARVDGAVFHESADAGHADVRSFRRAVLAYWQGLPEGAQSWVSVGVLARIDAGTEVDAAFGQETYREIRREAMRA